MGIGSALQQGVGQYAFMRGMQPSGGGYSTPSMMNTPATTDIYSPTYGRTPRLGYGG
jgi:hypothetical protein